MLVTEPWGLADVVGRIFGPKAVAEPGHAIGGGGEQELEAGFPGGGVGGLPGEIPGDIGLGIGADVKGVGELGLEFVGAGQVDVRSHRKPGVGAIHPGRDDGVAVLGRLGAADGGRAAATAAGRQPPPPARRATGMDSPRLRIGPPRTTSWPPARQEVIWPVRLSRTNWVPAVCTATFWSVSERRTGPAAARAAGAAGPG